MPDFTRSFDSIDQAFGSINAARVPKPGDERNQALFMALGDFDTGQRPSFWQPYKEARERVLARFLPVLARGDWVALLRANGDAAGFAPYDGFF